MSWWKCRDCLFHTLNHDTKRFSGTIGCAKRAGDHARFTENCDGRNEGVNWRLCLPSGQLFLHSQGQTKSLCDSRQNPGPATDVEKHWKLLRLPSARWCKKKNKNKNKKQTSSSKLFGELSTNLSQVAGSERQVEYTFWEAFRRHEWSYLDQFDECKNKGKQMKTGHMWRYTYSWHNLPQRKVRLKMWWFCRIFKICQKTMLWIWNLDIKAFSFRFSTHWGGKYLHPSSNQALCNKALFQIRS